MEINQRTMDFLNLVNIFRPPFWVVLTRLIFETDNQHGQTREFQNRVDLSNFSGKLVLFTAVRFRTLHRVTAIGGGILALLTENSEYEINFPGYSFSPYWSLRLRRMHQFRTVSLAWQNGICRSHNFPPIWKREIVLPTRVIVRKKPRG